MKFNMSELTPRPEITNMFLNAASLEIKIGKKVYKGMAELTINADNVVTLEPVKK